MFSSLLLIAIMVLFSIEDIRHMSIPSFWFYVLLFIVLIISFLHIVNGSSFVVFPSRVSICEELYLLFLNEFEVFILERTGSLVGYFVNQEMIISYVIPCITKIITRSLFGFILIGIPLYITKKRGIGDGDVFFFVVLSILFSFAHIWLAYCLAFFSGTVWCIIWYFCKNRNLPKKCPFIPFISIGFTVAMFLK